MKRIFIYSMLVILVLSALLPVSPIMASNTTLAEYLGTVRVTNNDTSSATNVFTTFNLTTQDLIDADFAWSNMTNSSMLTNASADTEYMPAPGTGEVWCVYVPSIIAKSSLDYKLYLGGAQDMDGDIRYYPGTNGMVTLDAAGLEPGSSLQTYAQNWTYEVDGWLDTTAAANKYILDKDSAVSVWVSNDGEITVDIGRRLYGGTDPNGNLYQWNDVNAWAQSAPQLNAQTRISSLAVYNNRLYGGTGATSRLFRWNGVDAWVQVAGQAGAETHISSLVVYNSHLYGATNGLGKLYEWNDVDAWVEVAPQLAAETQISALCVYNNKLYGGTIPNGLLYEWNGTDAWVQVAPQLNGQVTIYDLAVYNDELYGCTGNSGRLFKWNGTNAWVEVAPQLAAETQILDIEVYNGKLYGSTGQNGNLYEWNDVDAWGQVAPLLNAQTSVYCLEVYNGQLYGGTAPGGRLFQWNDVDAWTQVAPQLAAETAIYDLVTFGGQASAFATGVTSGDSTLKIDLGVFNLASGNRLNFTGVANSEIDVGAIAAHNNQPKFWCSMWFRLDDAFDATDPISQYMFGKVIGGNDRIYGGLLAGDGRFFWRQMSGAVEQFFIYSTENSWAANTWYHILFSLSDVNGARLRVNGGAAVTDPGSANTPNGGNLILGDSSAASAEGLIGHMSFVTIGTDDLLAAEEVALAAGYPPGDEVEQYYIDEGVGTEIFSYGSGANEGTAGAATAWGTGVAPHNLVISIDGSPVGGGHVADVGNNTNDWYFFQNGSVPYMLYQEITVDGVQQQYIEWENNETTFTDASGNGHDATPTFRTATSDADVTAELIAFVPASPAVASEWSIDDPTDMITAEGTPSGFYDETLNTTVPGVPIIVDVMPAGVPTNMFIVPLLLVFLCIVILLTGKFSLLAALIVGTLVLFMANPLGIPPWIGIIFFLDGMAFVIASKQFGW